MRQSLVQVQMELAPLVRLVANNALHFRNVLDDHTKRKIRFFFVFKM